MTYSYRSGASGVKLALLSRARNGIVTPKWLLGTMPILQASKV